MHWLRKSTEGWSVHSLMLDVSGGILSFTQMILDAVNNGKSFSALISFQLSSYENIHSRAFVTVVI